MLALTALPTSLYLPAAYDVRLTMLAQALCELALFGFTSRLLDSCIIIAQLLGMSP